MNASLCLTPTAITVIQHIDSVMSWTKTRGVAVECRTCDQEVVDLSLSRAPRRKKVWASFSHLCTSVTKQYNLVPVKGRFPCDWEVQTLWSVCGWQVKLCDPFVTHGPCLTSCCCPAWQLIRLIIAVLHDSRLCGWAVWLDYNKGSFIFIYLLSFSGQCVMHCCLSTDVKHSASFIAFSGQLYVL